MEKQTKGDAMSSFSGRTRTSIYLRNLNLPETPVEEQLINDEALAKDLALFTNTQFFDFDSGQNTDYQAPPVKHDAGLEAQVAISEDVSQELLMPGEYSPVDYISGEFSFGEYTSPFTSPAVPAFPENLSHLQPIQPSSQTAFPASVPQQPTGYVAPASVDVASNKRQTKLSSSGRQFGLEDASRLAAEEDKRRRNTAASARFRIKKKQREQALEKSAKEMSEKVAQLEGRIKSLEMENQWLKGLVTDKHGGNHQVLNKLMKEYAAVASEASRKVDNNSPKTELTTSTASSPAPDEVVSKAATRKG